MCSFMKKMVILLSQNGKLELFEYVKNKLHDLGKVLRETYIKHLKAATSTDQALAQNILKNFDSLTN